LLVAITILKDFGGLEVDILEVFGFNGIGDCATGLGFFDGTVKEFSIGGVAGLDLFAIGGEILQSLSDIHHCRTLS
jgi:hypothetical protein